MKKILLLAQTPPPFHGQAIMQQYLVDVKWRWCKKEHVRLDYSENIAQIGHFRFSKVSKLFAVLVKVLKISRKQSIDAIYYPPAGPNRVPLYRDIITLLVARLFAKKVVLHFHAGGLSQLIERLTVIEKFFAKLAFKNVDCAIVLLPWLQGELTWFSPKKVFVIPNGIEDITGNYIIKQKEKVQQAATRILFVGNLKAEKGIFILLAAAVKLKTLQVNFRIKIMGESHSEEVMQAIVKFIAVNKISENIALLGGLAGDAKWKEFCKADIFCLPTYATEAMPVSILEAMMFSLPVVSTQWRAIPDMITDGEEGFLTPVGNTDSLADRLMQLLNEPTVRLEMGKKARKKYECFYTLDKHLTEVEKAFKELLEIPS